MSKHKPEKTYLSNLEQNQRQFEQEFEYPTSDQLIQNEQEEDEKSPKISKSFENENYTFHQTRYSYAHYHTQYPEMRTQRTENFESKDKIKERSNPRSNPTNSKSTQLKENKTSTNDNKKHKRTRPMILHSRPPLNQVHQYFT